jgi:hypothetical protein
MNEDIEMTATFGPDEFERWWLHGMSRADSVSADDAGELLAACVDLALAERRRMTQTRGELTKQIAAWASNWNEHIAAEEE